jgi:hypothetical protein
MYGLEELRIVSGSLGAVVPMPTSPVAGKVFCAMALIVINGTANKTRVARVSIFWNPRFRITLYPLYCCNLIVVDRQTHIELASVFEAPMYTVERPDRSPA